jgi:hypothetical protein
VIDPETGEPALREEYQYFLVSLARVFVDPEDELRIDFLKENGRKQPQKRLNGSRRSSKKPSDDSLKENARMAKTSPYENRIYETKKLAYALVRFGGRGRKTLRNVRTVGWSLCIIIRSRDTVPTTAGRRLGRSGMGGS